MIAEHRQWSRKPAVEHLRRSQQMRLLRNPRFSGAGRHSHANTDMLLQHEPRSEGAHQLSTAVINNLEFVARESRWSCATLAAPQRQIRSAAQHLHNHLAGTKG